MGMQDTVMAGRGELLGALASAQVQVNTLRQALSMPRVRFVEVSDDEDELEDQDQDAAD